MVSWQGHARKEGIRIRGWSDQLQACTMILYRGMFKSCLTEASASRRGWFWISQWWHITDITLDSLVNWKGCCEVGCLYDVCKTCRPPTSGPCNQVFWCLMGCCQSCLELCHIKTVGALLISAAAAASKVESSRSSLHPKMIYRKPMNTHENPRV